MNLAPARSSFQVNSVKVAKRPISATPVSVAITLAEMRMDASGHHGGNSGTMSLKIPHSGKKELAKTVQ